MGFYHRFPSGPRRVFRVRQRAVLALDANKKRVTLLPKTLLRSRKKDRARREKLKSMRFFSCPLLTSKRQVSIWTGIVSTYDAVSDRFFKCRP